MWKLKVEWGHVHWDLVCFNEFASSWVLYDYPRKMQFLHWKNLGQLYQLLWYYWRSMTLPSLINYSFLFFHALPSFYSAWFTSNLITNPNRCSKQSAKNVCSNSSFCSHKWVFDLQLFGLRCLKSSTQMDGSNNIEKS